MPEESISEHEFTVSVFPVYIVCDESSSMEGASIQAVNDGILELFDVINADPIVDAKARVGIIAFESNARILLPLTQLSAVTKIPVCVVGQSCAHYGNLFRMLRFVIARDVRTLAQRFRIESRPLVFFISDGRPSDENWREERVKLTDPSFKFSPNIVSFGVSGAEKSVIAEVAHWGSGTGTKFFFMADVAGSPGEAIKEIIKFLTSDIYVSAPRSGVPPPDFQVPDGDVTTFVIDPLNP